MLTEEQIRTYKEDGILVLKGMVPPEKLQPYREAFERMVEKVRKEPNSRSKYGARLIGRTNDLDKDDESKKELWGADFLLHPDLYEPAFTDYLDNERLISSLESLLGPNMELYGVKALWSPVKATYDLRWHRDGNKDVYSTDGGNPPGWLQFNTALYREESFRVVKGSHLRPLTEEESAKYGTVEPVANEEICVLEPGDCMFMHQAVLHRGRAEADSHRRALHLIVARPDFPVGTRRLEQFKGWYEEMGLADKLGPRVKSLFENFFAWEGRTFDDVDYGTKYNDM